MHEPIAIPNRSPWITQGLVIRALFKREVATRFGKYRLGFFWMLFDPLLSVIVIGIVIGTLAERTVPEIPYAFFLLNGFLLLRLFTSPMSTGVKAVSANQGLLIYPSVTALDTLIARFLFDLLTTAFSFCVFCLCAMWWGIRMDLGSLHLIAYAYLVTWLCGCGFGMLFGVGVAYYKELEKVVPIIQRPLLFISAVLYPSSVLPDSVRELFLYNPLVHTIEISRNALFPLYHIEGANFTYPSVFAIVILAIGLRIYHNCRYTIARV